MSHPVSGQPRSQRRRRMVVGGVTAAATAALAVGAVVVVDPLGWRGPVAVAAAQVVPDDAVSYLHLDLHPGITQQVEMARFARRFPWVRQHVSAGDAAGVKQQLIEQLLASRSCTGLGYDADLKGWLGDEVVLARRAKASGDVLVLQSTNEKAARAAAPKLARCLEWQQVGVAYRQGNLVLAHDRAQADAVVADGTARPLSGRSEFTDDFAKVGSQGVVSFWGTAAGFRLMRQEVRTSGGCLGGKPATQLVDALVGRLDLQSGAGTVRFTNASPELRMVARSSKTLQTSTSFTHLDALPADTAVAMGLSDGNSLFLQNWATVKKSLTGSGVDLAAWQKRTGLRLPGDAETLLGEDATLAWRKRPATVPTSAPMAVALTSTADHASLASMVARQQKAVAVGRAAAHPSAGATPSTAAPTAPAPTTPVAGAGGVRLVPGRGGVQVLGRDAAWVARVAGEKRETLGADPGFQDGYPYPEQAQAGLYVNLQDFSRELLAGRSPAERANLAVLKTVAVTEHTEDAGYSVVVARLTAK